MSDANPMKSFADLDFTKFFADFKFPGMPDVDTLMAAHRRNMETMTAANRVAIEGAQTVARRHMEIMQQSMTDLTEQMRALTAQDSPQAKASKQADLLKTAYEKAVAHMRELADLIQKSNAEAVALVNQRFTEAMEELRALVAKTAAEGQGAVHRATGAATEAAHRATDAATQTS